MTMRARCLIAATLIGQLVFVAWLVSLACCGDRGPDYRYTIAKYDVDVYCTGDAICWPAASVRLALTEILAECAPSARLARLEGLSIKFAPELFSVDGSDPQLDGYYRRSEMTAHIASPPSSGRLSRTALSHELGHHLLWDRYNDGDRRHREHPEMWACTAAVDQTLAEGGI